MIFNLYTTVKTKISTTDFKAIWRDLAKASAYACHR